MGRRASCDHGGMHLPARHQPGGGVGHERNVFEWTAPEAILRGGSWGSNRWNARCASRFRIVPDYFYNFIGFRVVVSLVRG